MFKKIILIALIVGNSYAVEPNKDMEGNSIVNNITQGNITQQMSSITITQSNKEANKETKEAKNDTDSNNIDNSKTVIFQDDGKAFLYSDNFDIPKEEAKKESKNKKIDEQQFAISIDKLFLKYPKNNNSNEKVFDLTNLRPKQFKNMTNDEKDWARLLVYNNFSRLCQAFIQRTLLVKELNLAMKNQFLGAKETKFCVLTGFNIKQIFLDELLLNVDLKCYNNQPGLEPIKKQLAIFACSLVRTQQFYRKQMLEKGLVNNFDL